MVAEIQTTYDPCTCSLNGLPSENSTIEILPFTTTTTTIDATIEGTATQQIANNGQMLATTDGKTAATSNGGDFEKIIAAGQAGLKGYTEWDGYKNQYDGMVNKWNDEYKNKLVKDWFDEYVKKHKQYQGITGLNDKLTLWNNLGKTDDEFKKSIGVKNLNDYEQNNDWYALKSIAGYLPYVGTAIGIIDFFVNGGSQAEPAKPSPPMVFNVSLKLKGTLTTPYSQRDISFLNPGSPTLTALPALQPYYNNILGVFNILKPPHFMYGSIKPQTELVFYGDDDHSGVILPNITAAEVLNRDDYNNSMNSYLAETIFKQYKLGENVKYILNPASKLEVDLIDACFIFEYDNSPDLLINNRRFNSNVHNNPSYPYYPDIFKSSTSFSDRIKQIENTGLDLEYLSADKSKIRFRTKYVPLSCLSNVTFNLYNGQAPKIYIKMLVKMKRIDIVNAEDITQVVTYDISSSANSAIEFASNCKIYIARDNMFSKIYGIINSSTIGGNFDAFQIHEGLSLDGFSCLPFNDIPKYQNVTYTSNMNQHGFYGTITFPDYTIISDNTFIKASKIILGKQLSFGTNVHLISAEQMEVGSENTISPEVILEIQPLTNLDLWQCPNTDIATLKATDEEILAICNSSNYVNSVTFNKKGNENSNDNTKTESQNGKVLSISPNPTNGIASIQFSSSDKSMVTIEIFNLTGKLLSTPVKELDIKEGIYNWNIDLANFENGIYIFRLSGTDGYTECKKVVLIK